MTVRYDYLGEFGRRTEKWEDERAERTIGSRMLCGFHTAQRSVMDRDGDFVSVVWHHDDFGRVWAVYADGH